MPKSWFRTWGLILLLALAVQAADRQPLAELTSVGGLSVRGLARFEMKIYPDGELSWYNQSRDETLPLGGQPGNPKGFNGWIQARLKPADLERLKKAIDQTPFETLKPATSNSRPSASDGGDTTVIFLTSQGARTLNLWQVPGAEKLPAVSTLLELRQQYAR